MNAEIKTPKEMMAEGLDVMGWSKKRIAKAKFSTNLRRFRCFFGSHPKVLAAVYEDLQTTEIDAARILNINISDFLMSR